MNADKHMAENFRTIGQLIRYLIDDMKATQFSPYDTVATNHTLLANSTHLFRLSSKEAEQLRNSKYRGNKTIDCIKQELLFDYCVLKLEEFQKSRSINSYKNYLMQE